LRRVLKVWISVVEDLAAIQLKKCEAVSTHTRPVCLLRALLTGESLFDVLLYGNAVGNCTPVARTGF
jgi:hypothetical protein